MEALSFTLVKVEKTMQRHAGYVASCRQKSGGISVWRVTVKDAGSPHNGQSFVVASVHDGIVLARGLNVDFVVGTVDDEKSQKVFRAVDVRLAV